MRGQKYAAVAQDDFHYDDNPWLQWEKDAEYAAYDDGHTLTIASEAGGNVYLIDKSREWFWNNFTFTKVGGEGADTDVN
ncbi:hypothetical protein [Paenibacillus sp. M2]|uniref:hypothetical protein n=1 Tax=Paenibacillus sp. M2 TaxID=3341793 RepID=UPI00398A2973